MARWLITGGAGFIGSHLAEALIGKGETVRIADSFITGHRRNLAVLGDRAELVEGDLAEAAVAARAVAGMDYVLHQAAIPSVPRSVQDPVTSNRANVDATLQVLLAARDASVRRVVYAASSSAYGDTPTLPKREDMPTRPLSPYALQKLVGEQYMQLFTSLYGLETVSIRYFNVFGPRQDPSSPYSGVIAPLRDGAAGGQGARPSPATEVRRATSRTSPTWSTACCGRLPHQARRARSSTSPPAGRFRSPIWPGSLAALLGSVRLPCTSTRAPATCAIPWPTSRRRRRFSATSRSWDWRRAYDTPWNGIEASIMTFAEGCRRAIDLPGP